MQTAGRPAIHGQATEGKGKRATEYNLWLTCLRGPRHPLTRRSSRNCACLVLVFLPPLRGIATSYSREYWRSVASHSSPSSRLMCGNLSGLDSLAALPAEVSFRILCFLDTTSLCKAAQVSRRWRQLADDDVVWHRMCEQHIDRICTKCGWGLPLLERKRLRASKRQIQLRATGRGINEWSPAITPNPEASEDLQAPAEPVLDHAPSDHESSSTHRLSPVACKKSASLAAQENDYFRKTRPWKDVYKDRFMVGSNWKYGRCSSRSLPAIRMVSCVSSSTTTFL